MSSSWGRRRCAAGALLCAGALAYMPHASGLAAMVSVSAPRFVVAVPPEEKAMRRPSPATVAAASTSLQDLGFVVLRANEGVLDTQLVDSAREEARVDLECMLSRLRKLGFDTDKDSFRCVCWRADVCRDAPHAVPRVRVASLRTQPHADARVRVFAHPPHTHTHTYTHTHTHRAHRMPTQVCEYLRRALTRTHAHTVSMSASTDPPSDTISSLSAEGYRLRHRGMMSAPQLRHGRRPSLRCVCVCECVCARHEGA
jgi:hypothetical protein